jgi:hypothetical protein
MSRAAGALVVVAGCVVAGCGGAVVDAVGPYHLAAPHPAQLEIARAVVFTFSSKHACGELIGASAVELDDAVADEGELASVQRIPMLRGQIDPDRGAPNFEDGAATHTFGEVPSNVNVALVALAVDRDPGGDFALDDLAGSVFAVACRDVVPDPGKRVEVPLVLTPAGLR